MKLATYHDGSRDGQLVVVSRDLASAHFATGIATRMQQLLDDWNFVSPQLEDLYATLNGGKARHAFAFEPAKCMAPLPRAHQWVVGAAYPGHVERLARGRGVEVAPDLHDAPALRRGAGDHFLGACDEARFVDEQAGIDVEVGLVAMTGDVARGADAARALDGVRMLLLAADWSLRHPPHGAGAPGAAPLCAYPATAFAPVAVTPDELGDAWQRGRVCLNVELAVNGKRIGRVDAADGMAFDFGRLVARLAGVRALGAGSLVGAGAASQADASRGFACLAEKRALEALEQGAPRTAYLRFGDRVRAEVRRRDGQSVFGAIEQAVAAYVA
ncbi:MAG: fumarylacetoacetate hydrolase family protein [Gammaproteobacteria bacterium]